MEGPAEGFMVVEKFAREVAGTRRKTMAELWD